MNHKDFFFIILDILEKNNIEYCLFAGTLLGAVRDKNFLPGDHKDTDIALDSKDYWKVRYLLNQYITDNKFKWYSILRKEISVCDKECNFKVDMFFMDEENNDYYVYSYKPNSENKKWNHEWRAIFPKDAFFPSEKIKFLGRKVSIPHDYDKILTSEYGNWKIPDSSWVSSDTQVLNVDTQYPGFFPAGINPCQYNPKEPEYNIGFILINFYRKDSTKDCINSIKNYYPNVKIYVADQDEPSGEMIEFYEENNIEYYYVPYDSGLSYCRNFLLEKVREPFLMWGDNDFVFTKDSNIAHGLKILSNYPEIGFAGGGILVNGKLQHYERILNYNSDYNTLVYIPLELTNPPKNSFDNIEFYYCDLTFNYVICKTEILQNNKSLRWNSNLKVAYEHTSMFLCIQQFNTYRVVYCPSMQVIHAHSFKHAKYNELRKRKDAGTIFGKIWNLKMNFTIGQGREIYEQQNITSDKELLKQTYIIETPKEEKTPVDLNKFIETSPTTSNDGIKNFLTVLNDKKIEYWLLKQSCLECLKYNEIYNNNIVIGVKDMKSKESILNLINSKGFEINVEIVIENRKLKPFVIYGIPIQVPSPVVRYLENEYKEEFAKLMNKNE